MCQKAEGLLTQVKRFLAQNDEKRSGEMCAEGINPCLPEYAVPLRFITLTEDHGSARAGISSRRLRDAFRRIRAAALSAGEAALCGHGKRLLFPFIAFDLSITFLLYVFYLKKSILFFAPKK
jgi:hypothetical protein